MALIARPTPAAPVVVPSSGATPVEPGDTSISTKDDGDDRGALAAGAVGALSLAGTIKTGVETARVAAAFPNAKAQGWKKTLKWASELALGGTNDIVPYQKGLWRTSYLASNGISSALGVAEIGAALPNLWDAVDRNGVSGLWDTKSGRTGSAQMLSGVAVTGFTIQAARTAQEGESRWLASIASGARSSNLVMLATGLMGVTTILNETGALNFLNKDNDKSLGEIELGAARNAWNHPMLVIGLGGP
jgi:hypothetical protein